MNGSWEIQREEGPKGLPPFFSVPLITRSMALLHSSGKIQRILLMRQGFRRLSRYGTILFLFLFLQALPGISRAATPLLDGNGGWLGEQGPIPPPDLSGKVVLFDFWDYTCINCIRTFPHLNHLYRKYRSRGLVVVAIHSPEFSFAGTSGRVQKAIELYRLRFPVLLDKNQRLWTRFHNHYWPADYLFDRKGQLVYHAFGEGGYGLLEARIRQALGLSSQQRGTADEPSFPEDLTPELYAGTARGRLGNPSGFHPDGKASYTGHPVRPNLITLHGLWKTEADHITSLSPNPGQTTSLTVIYHGSGVNAVLKRTGKEENLPVLVYLDKHPLPGRFFGRDVLQLSDQETGIHLEEARMYSLISGQPYGLHRLDLVFPEPGTALYTLTFNP